MPYATLDLSASQAKELYMIVQTLQQRELDIKLMKLICYTRNYINVNSLFERKRLLVFCKMKLGLKVIRCTINTLVN